MYIFRGDVRVANVRCDIKYSALTSNPPSGRILPMLLPNAARTWKSKSISLYVIYQLLSSSGFFPNYRVTKMCIFWPPRDYADTSIYEAPKAKLFGSAVRFSKLCIKGLFYSKDGNLCEFHPRNSAYYHHNPGVEGKTRLAWWLFEVDQTRPIPLYQTETKALLQKLSILQATRIRSAKFS